MNNKGTNRQRAQPVVMLRIEGERALFARPEFRSDLVTYDIITPHAARGVLDAIYWRPGMTWIVDAIHVLCSIRTEVIAEAGRRSIILRDVSYVVDAHFETEAGADTGRHAAMFKRLALAAPRIHLGRAAFPGHATLLGKHETIERIAGNATIDHGWLLHSIDFGGDQRPRFFHAVGRGGLVAVPPPNSRLLFG